MQRFQGSGDGCDVRVNGVDLAVNSGLFGAVGNVAERQRIACTVPSIASLPGTKACPATTWRMRRCDRRRRQHTVTTCCRTPIDSDKAQASLLGAHGMHASLIGVYLHALLQHPHRPSLIRQAHSPLATLVAFTNVIGAQRLSCSHPGASPERSCSDPCSRSYSRSDGIQKEECASICPKHAISMRMVLTNDCREREEKDLPVISA
mmetsp:Transcript_58750/g.138112  ORF Transcript_58750/g.138112 Transcript_58750/m.138112 type:complete len:206 (-) Transcript_58750:203-820(-)